MGKKLDTPAQERSTYVIAMAFIEKDYKHNIGPVEITPKTIQWTLVDDDGNIVNSRDNVSLPGNKNATIVLSGLDLALSGDYPEERHVIIEGTYDSIYGDDLPFREQVTIQIENLTD